MLCLMLGHCAQQVAHAYLHAESTPAGRLDDGSIVAQVLVLSVIEKPHVQLSPDIYKNTNRVTISIYR